LLPEDDNIIPVDISGTIKLLNYLNFKINYISK